MIYTLLTLISALPLSAPIAGQRPYATAQDAMHAAALAAIGVSNVYESGGAIYATSEDAYYFTQPVTAHATTEIDYRVAAPAGARLIALYHTHPGHTGTADEFSDSDARTARRLRTPMYVVSVASRIVLGLNIQGFSLDATPVHLQTLTINGVTYIVRADHGTTLLLERNGREFIYHKPRAPS